MNDDYKFEMNKTNLKNLVKIVQLKAEEVFDDEAKAEEWMSTRQDRLDCKTPTEYIYEKHETGADDVILLLSFISVEKKSNFKLES